MKKILLSILILLYSSTCFSLDYITTNKAKISWEAVTTLESGEVLPQGSVIKYMVYTMNQSSINQEIKEVPYSSTFDGSQTSCIITFTEEGKYIIGIKALRIINSSTTCESKIAWSNDEVATNNKTFGVQYFSSPSSVTNLREGD